MAIQLVCSTLDVLSSDLVGPVCVIGTTRSVFNGAGGLRGAVMVNTPSDDNVDWTSFGFEPAKFGLNVSEMSGKEINRDREKQRWVRKYYYFPILIEENMVSEILTRQLITACELSRNITIGQKICFVS